MTYLTVYKCRNHPHIFSLCLDEPYGCGTRLSSVKCCGIWEPIEGMSWPVDQYIIDAIDDVELEEN